MKIESVEGLVLTETNYSESSKILNVLTKEYGLIGMISKGCRNMKSKLHGVSRKLVLGTFHIYYKENGLSTLIGVDVSNSFSKTLMDLERISYASLILDLTLQVVKQTDSSEIFDLVKDTLEKIDEGLNPMALTNILELKLLESVAFILSKLRVKVFEILDLEISEFEFSDSSSIKVPSSIVFKFLISS
jgi:DNA repair protein RecO (recombination protein O)